MKMWQKALLTVAFSLTCSVVASAQTEVAPGANNSCPANFALFQNGTNTRCIALSYAKPKNAACKSNYTLDASTNTCRLNEFAPANNNGTKGNTCPSGFTFESSSGKCKSCPPPRANPSPGEPRRAHGDPCPSRDPGKP